MPQYLIIAKDGNDEDALQRRKDVRPFHLQGAKKLKADGHFIIGGATLDDNGNMNGSVMIVEFDNEQHLQDWMDIEPYIRDGVWKEIEVKSFRVAQV